MAEEARRRNKTIHLATVDVFFRQRATIVRWLACGQEFRAAHPLEVDERSMLVTQASEAILDNLVYFQQARFILRLDEDAPSTHAIRRLWLMSEVALMRHRLLLQPALRAKMGQPPGTSLEQTIDRLADYHRSR